jgi:hypothetical protein
MTKRKQLSPALRGLLKEVVGRRCPDLLGVLDVAPLSIPRQDRDRIAIALGEEFGATGLRPDSEPNERGLELENLIDYMCPAHDEPESSP